MALDEDVQYPAGIPDDIRCSFTNAFGSVGTVCQESRLTARDDAARAPDRIRTPEAQRRVTGPT